MIKLSNYPLETAQQREELLLYVSRMMIQGKLRRGQVVRHLRKALLQMTQSEFAKYSKVSRRTLTEIENDSKGLNEESLNRVLSIFGLQLGVVPISQSHAKRICNEQQS